MPSEFKRYSLYAANFGGILLRDLFDQSFRTQTKKSIIQPGGDLHPRAVVTCCADPMIRFSTKDFAGVFAGAPNVGQLNSGYPINVGTALTTAALLQFQQRAPGSSFYAANTNNHVVGTSEKGFLYVSEISARQDDERGSTITLDYALHSTDGIAEPVAWSDAAQLTSSPAFGGIWYMGPVRAGTVGSSMSNLNGVVGWTLRTGIDYRPPRADGSVFSLNGSMHAVLPEIRLQTLNPDMTAAFLGSMFGQSYASASLNLHFYLWKGVHGGARVAAATAEHMRISSTTGDQTTESLQSVGIDDATGEVVIRPTNNNMLLSPNVAIQLN